MSFHLSSWSIKKPIPTLVGFVILTLVGINSFLNLGIDNNPNIDIPAVKVEISQAGAGPTELEFQVTRKVEDAVASLDKVDQIYSTVRQGSSTTIIDFDLGVDSDRATNDVRNAVSRIRQDLPADIDEPIINRITFAGGPIMTYAVTSSQSVVEISNLVDEVIIPELLNIRGVAQINRLGGINREILVELNPSRLLAYALTADEVNEQIRSFNVNVPGGRAKLYGNEQNIRVLGSAATVEELKEYPISLSDGSTVVLEELGTVKDAFREVRQEAWLDNQPVVAFSVLRSTGSSLVEVETAVQQTVEQLEQKLSGVNLELIFTRADEIRNSYQGTMSSLVLGCLLTVVTVGVFLRDWRVTLITAVALPLSIIPTFAVMKALNYTLNSMTLLGLALAIGNLVDDAICMIDNIDQHLEQGKKPYRAAIDGATEIGLAVVATTATIVAVFMPVAFMGGIPGQFFQPFGLTVSVATMFSTLVACTITPLMCAYLLKPKIIIPEAMKTSRMGLYSRLLGWALTHRVVTLILAVVFFIGSLQLIPFIPKGLFSEGDRGFTTVQMQLPPGASLAQTNSLVARVTQVLASNSATSSVFATAGEDGSVNQANLYVNLVPKTDREISLDQFQAEMRQAFGQIPGVKISFQSQGAGGGNKDVEVILQSKDGQLLGQTAKQIETQMRQISGLVEVGSSISLIQPEIIVKPNPKRAKDLGVSTAAIASTASVALLGDVDSNLAKYNLSDRQIEIRVKLQPQYQEDIDVLKNLKVPGRNNTLVPISSVAQIYWGSGPAQIERYNRNRQVTLFANLQGISLGEAMEQIQSLETMRSLPQGVKQEPAGDAEIMQEIFARFLGALALSVLLIYAILVLLYNNFLYPLAILTALPLSIGGAFLALLITQKELALFALIGIVLLMGLVTKNAILLVDFALAGLNQEKSLFNAIFYAGTSRLRPILMTSVSTIAGMIPIALELGADGETRSPMAIAVIGGFSTSTLLTLIVVPVVFTYIHRGYGGLRKLLHKNITDQQDLNLID